MSEPEPAEEGSAEEDRWLVVRGRRWRRTDPALPEDLAAALRSHLGSARSAVGAAQRRGDADAVAAARRRVGIAKHGLGERGPAWWDEPVEERVARARGALAELEADARPRDVPPECVPDPLSGSRALDDEPGVPRRR